MLSRKHRISRLSFEGVLRQGSWQHSAHLTLRTLASRSQGQARFAVSVSKKVAKKAVARNLLKRRLFSVLESVVGKVPPSTSGIFFFKKGSSDISFAMLKEEALFLLKKSGVLG